MFGPFGSALASTVIEGAHSSEFALRVMLWPKLPVNCSDGVGCLALGVLCVGMLGLKVDFRLG